MMTRSVNTSAPSQGIRGVSIACPLARMAKHWASGSVDTNVRLWNVATGNELQTLTGHTVGCL